MEYALVNNGYVRFGPVGWNTRIFNSVLSEELGIDYRVAIDQESSVPLTINESTKILPVRNEYQGTGSFGRTLVGPTWNVTDTEAVASYVWQDHPIETVKQDLKSIVAAERYKKQNEIITVTVSGTAVAVMPNKTTKDELVSAIADGITSRNWKFGNTWLVVDNAGLQTVVDAIANHVQTQFDWEASRVGEIDSKSSLAELGTWYDAFQQSLNPPPPETPET